MLKKTNKEGRKVCGDSQDLKSSGNVSVNSKPDHPPPGRPPGIRTFSLPGPVRLFAQLSLPGGRGFELLLWEKFSIVLKENAGTSRFVLRNRRQLEKQVFLCCFISIFAKTVDDFCIFNNKYKPFSAISVIQGSLLLLLDHLQNFECLT